MNLIYKLYLYIDHFLYNINDKLIFFNVNLLNKQIKKKGKEMFKLFKLSNKKTKLYSIFALVFVALQGVFEGLQAGMLAAVLSVLGQTNPDSHAF